MLELGDQHAAFGIAHDGLAQSRRRPSVGGVAEHVGDRRRDALRARRSPNCDAGPSCGDAYGVVGLIASVVQDDERHPRGECLDDGAVAAVRDDEVGVRQHQLVRCGCHDNDIRGRAERRGLDRRPGRDEPSNRHARERIGDALQAVDVIWKVDDMATSTSRPSPAGGDQASSSSAHAGSSRMGPT